MSFDPVTAAFDLGGKLIDKLFPDPTQRDAAKLKMLEMQQSGELAEIAAKTEQMRIDAEDRNSARQREMAVKDWIPGTLSMGITVGFFSVLGWMLIHGVPDKGGEAMFIMLGSLGTAWGQCISYYFGSSSSSDKKTQLMANMATTK